MKKDQQLDYYIIIKTITHMYIHTPTYKCTDIYIQQTYTYNTPVLKLFA